MDAIIDNHYVFEVILFDKYRYRNSNMETKRCAT